MKDLLNVTVCQCGVIWESPDRNMSRLDGFISGYLDRCREGVRPDWLRRKTDPPCGGCAPWQRPPVRR